MDYKKLIEKAKRKTKQLQKLRRDPRYLKTIGKLKREGLLDVRDVPAYRGQIFLEDALWAAELESRIYELLPAIIARRPKFFAFLKLPEDLAAVVGELKRGRAETYYRDIAPEKYRQWDLFMTGDATTLKVMKTFRLSQKDLETLGRLSREEKKSQTQILRQALREYAEKSERGTHVPP